MNEPRYASLSGNLLARKGGAKPAMRPLSSGMADDLGWNDMGFDAGHGPERAAPIALPASSLAALTPAPRPLARDEKAPVHLQQQALEETFLPEEPIEGEAVDVVADTAVEAEIVRLPRRAAGTTGRKAAFTLRLDAGRHLRLRLATAVTGRSAQQLVTEALDHFLESHPEVANLADQLPGQSGRRS